MYKSTKLLLILCSLIWYYKCTSLPKLYYDVSKRKIDLPVKVFRDFEKCGEKLVKRKADIQYFEKCLRLGILPKFLEIKFPKLKVYKDKTSIHTEILRKQIAILKKEKCVIEERFSRLKERFRSQLSVLEYFTLITKLNQHLRQTTLQTLDIHNKKLINLWRSKRTPSPDCLLNISSRKLSIIEEDALRLGLKHHILPAKVDEMDTKAGLERLYSRIKSERPGLERLTYITDDLRHATQSFFNACKGICGARRNKDLHETLRKLRNDRSISVCSFDKGNGVIIMNNPDYFEKLDKIVLDTTKFKEIKHGLGKPHPIIQKENSIIRYLKKNVKPFVSESSYNRLVPSGSQPGKIYGLCKVHKDNYPLRPVVSMVGTAEYELAKFMDSWIKPHIPCSYMLNSTATFIDRIKSFVFQKTHILVSFDVISLFTNIPLKETIDMVCDYVYRSDSKPPFPKETFKRLLEIATGGYFLYKYTLCCQVDAGMGSPLGPTLANFFLAHFETKFMADQLDFAPDLYLRYVDDIFCVFKSHAHVLRFLEFLNSLHQNLKFTYELGPDQLAYLDTFIRLPTDDFDSVSSTVYRKPSNTNVILNFTAMCPQSWKLGLITCFINRAYTVCSTWKLFDGEVERLKSIFMSNGYPLQFFSKCVSSFLDKKMTQTVKRVVPVDVEFVPIICLPYTGHPSLNFKRRLISKFRSNLKPNGSIRS